MFNVDGISMEWCFHTIPPLVRNSRQNKTWCIPFLAKHNAILCITLTGCITFSLLVTQETKKIKWRSQTDNASMHPSLCLFLKDWLIWSHWRGVRPGGNTLHRPLLRLFSLDLEFNRTLRDKNKAKKKRKQCGTELIRPKFENRTKCTSGLSTDLDRQRKRD